MSDNTEIHNLLSDEQMNEALTTYSESNLEYINDYNSGSYQGQINFDTLICERKYVTWSDAFLTIPITVTGLSAAYDAASLATFKSSVLSFITGVQVSITGNNTIFSDNNVSLINSIRLIVEKDLDFKNPQTQLSQGMWRALALVTHLNSCTFSKNKKLILIDDIGEGLDYERSVAIIDLLISKAKTNDIQLMMTSNDRFVMNEVPLEYWSVLKRKKGIVKMFNLRNSQKQFDEFKYIGLSNFDFFASDFFESEATND